MIEYEQDRKGFLGGLFRKKTEQPRTVQYPRVTEPEGPDYEEQEIIPGKWYRASWDGLEGIAQLILDGEGENESEYEFHLKLPNETDVNTVRVSHSTNTDSYDFYLVSYQITGKKRGEVRKVFWQTEDDNCLKKFGWYIGSEFEQEEGVDNYSQRSGPIEL